MIQEFKKAAAGVQKTACKRLFRIVDGKRVETGQEYAEVCFVPNWLKTKKDGPVYRFWAIREPLKADNGDKKGSYPSRPWISDR